ncbi:CoA transferase, partial [Azospirillum brasilense]|uniref:CoA transferase n=1 Tax=Azospirillum brasilense TaxID=192 RepID=UPI0024952169
GRGPPGGGGGAERGVGGGGGGGAGHRPARQAEWGGGGGGGRAGTKSAAGRREARAAPAGGGGGGAGASKNRQWKALGKATGLTERLAMIGPLMDVDINDEGGRFVARDAISAVLAPWFAARTLAEVESAFAGAGVLWGPYRDFGQLVAEDARCSTANPLFREVEQPEVGPLLVPGSPLGFPGLGERTDHRPAPVLGQDTDAVLADLLGLPSAEIGRLHDAGIVA